jgi:hypothetical protein
MYGYYLFLGRGDWGTSRAQTLDPTFDGNVNTRLLGDWGPHRKGTPLSQAPEWSSAWSLDTWKHHIDFLVDTLGADTLALCMNGFELPYPSERFPEAVELDHANVKREFLPQALDHARRRGLKLIAMFCTTGHATGFALSHPECTTVGPNGERHPTNLCHHHPLGRGYAEGVAREMLTRYPGFGGVSFHPPENAVPCRCEYCRAEFHRQTGKDYQRASDKEISDFYWASCLGFQRSLENLASSLIPGASVYAVTIPGRFEQDFSVVAREIPKTTMLLHWDYWSFRSKIPDVLNSLRLFRSQGHCVGFIPSSGWSLDRCGPDYGEQVVEQINAVRAEGVRDLLYFVGAIWHEPSLRATSAGNEKGRS